MLRELFSAPRLGATVVSALVICGFVLVLALLLLRPIGLEGAGAEILKVMVGILGAKFGDVVAFHINSSAGSKAKDDIIAAQLAPPKAGA